MNRTIIFLLSCFFACSSVLAQSQELSQDEEKVIKEKYYGNRNYWEGIQAANLLNAQQFFRKALDTFLVESNWKATIDAGADLIMSHATYETYPSALSLADSLIGLIKQEVPEYYEKSYRIYYGKAYIYLVNQKAAEGLEASSIVLDMLRKKYDTELNLNFVDTYSFMGYAHQYLGDLDSSIYYIQKSYDILLEMDLDRPDMMANTLLNISNLEHIKGNYDKTIRLAEEALSYAIQAFGEQHINLYRHYSMLINCYHAIAEYEKCIEYCQKTLYVIENTEDVDKDQFIGNITTLLTIISGSYIELKDTEHARIYYDKVLTHLNAHPLYEDKNPIIYELEGKLYLEEEAFEAALKSFMTARAEITKKKQESVLSIQERSKLSDILMITGHTYQLMHQLDSAEHYFRASIDTAEQLYDNDHPFWIPSTYSKLSDIFIEKQQLDSAMLYNQKAILEICYNYNSYDYFELPPPSAFGEATDTYYLLFQKANILKQMAENCQQSDSSNHLLNQALAFIDLSDKVHEENLKKINLYRSSQSKTLIDFSITNYRLGMELAHLSHDLQPSSRLVNQSFYYTQKMKAQQLWMSMLNSNSKNIANLDKSLRIKESDLLADIAYYEKEIREAAAIKDTATVRQYTNEQLFQAKEGLTRLYRQMEAEYPEYYASKYAFVPENEGSLKKIMRNEEVLIEYVLMDSFLFTFVITQDDPLKLYRSRVSSEFEDQVNEMNTLLTNSTMLRPSSRERFIKLSHLLYGALIQPISAEIREKKRLVIIGDGLINYIPFEVLVASEEPSTFDQLDYLINEFEIVYHYSATLFAKARKSPHSNNEGLYAFAPVYDEGTESAEVALDTDNFRAFDENGVFSPLPESEREVNDIAKLFKQNGRNTLISLRQEAIEGTLKQQLNQPHQYIHLAGHSFADLKNPNFSGVACYPDSTNTEEDGILYTGELFGLRTSADLITLSSCESGLGKLQGTEGLLGLNRSFIYAGAQNVVFSLWKTYDKVSAQLMVDFYRGIIEEEHTYSASLREAKLTQISNPATASPHYWGAYLLIGR